MKQFYYLIGFIALITISSYESAISAMEHTSKEVNLRSLNSNCSGYNDDCLPYYNIETDNDTINESYATVYFYSSECKHPEQHCYYIKYSWQDDVAYITDVHVHKIDSHPTY